MKKGSSRQVLWAPWRLEYILGEKESGCIFCSRVQQSPDNDEKNLILTRGETCFVIMNRYPYNNGHLMVVPYRHTGDLTELTPAENQEIMAMLQQTLQVLTEAMTPDGFNIGLNLGKVAGAGVDDHLHFHIVPRWDADTNFMPVIGDTRVIPEALNATYRKLLAVFDKMKP